MNWREIKEQIPHVEELALFVPEFDDRDDNAGEGDVVGSGWPFRFGFGGSAADNPPVRFGTLSQQSTCIH